MTSFKLTAAALGASLLALLAAPAQAQVIISEVNANGSSASYAADWFELTNTGATAVNISGWTMDDNSNAFASSVVLRGVTSIAAGQSVVFLEGTATGTTDASIAAAFKSAWFGSAPTSVVIGGYGGSGVGLSATADAVNIFNSSGTAMAGVSFGSSTTGVTFDNHVGLSGTISQLSTVGVNGAFKSFNNAEIGSPGSIASVPEPEGYALALAGMGVVFAATRRRKSAV